MVSKCSAESENRAMADLTYDLIWVKDLLTKLGFTLESPNNVLIQSYNQAFIHIVENLVFHECTKHIEVDCYLVH